MKTTTYRAMARYKNLTRATYVTAEKFQSKAVALSWARHFMKHHSKALGVSYISIVKDTTHSKTVIRVK